MRKNIISKAAAMLRPLLLKRPASAVRHIGRRGRLLCLICAVSFLLSNTSLSFAATKLDDGLKQQSFLLYPREGDEAQAVALDGMMPPGAEAQAVDVTAVPAEDSTEEPAAAESIEEQNAKRTKTQQVKAQRQARLSSSAELPNAADFGATPDEALAEPTAETTTQAEDYEPAESESYRVIAAYDITILFEGEEFQPREDHPIHVEIIHPAIHENGLYALWHVKDDGKREEIPDFEVAEGKLSFYATGFSIYEVADIDGRNPSSPAGWSRLSTLEQLIEAAQNGQGIYIGSGRNGDASAGHFLSGFIKTGSDNIGIAKTKDNYLPTEGADITEVNPGSDTTAAAVPYYLEITKDPEMQLTGANKTTKYEALTCRIYCMDGGTKQYITHESGAASLGMTSNVEEAKEFIIFKNSQISRRFFIQDADLVEDSFWNEWGGVGYDGKKSVIIGVYKYESNALYQFWVYNSVNAEQGSLDGKTYGIFHYTNGSTMGNALMAQGDTHSLIKLVLFAEDNDRVLYVDENREINQWTFRYDPADDRYLITTTVDDKTMYLQANGSRVTVTDDPGAAGRFEAIISSGDRIKLKSGSNYLTFNPGDDGTSGSFGVTTNGANTLTWLYLLKPASLKDNDYITFSADRVSVSDIPDGQEVIVYLRIWNEEDLRYDMYAVDRDGSLYPCFASGGKIMWLGDETTSLVWKFTEYKDSVTKEPNYYYELYNPYSEKYLAPQMNGNQVLSENTIGINMPGRRNGEFYSNIIAWDNTRYAYIGLRPNADKTALEPCSESASLPFYFATLEPLNLSDRLHEVPTIDNNKYGITMKMVNFSFAGEDNSKYGDAYSADITKDYFGGTPSTGSLITNLLSDNLKENGYPDTNMNLDLGDAYASAIPVNHLFLERVHESSGYFEFDSCQNFATLRHLDENGNFQWNSGENGETDFILYHELGTHDRSSTAALKHGQFFPYDVIEPGVYASSNPTNLYTSMTDMNNNLSIGLLSDEDPRKYEQLHKIKTEERKEADYYFGMEMEASFVQTPSGLDAWGHDIIFEFTGDDDFWLYVDGDLVLDLGGTHAAVMGTINFRTGEVSYDKKGSSRHGVMETTTLRKIFETNYKNKHPEATGAEVEAYLNEIFADDNPNIFKDYSSHNMKIFYMERGGNASNLHMRFNIASVTPGNVVVNKSVSGDGADELETDFVEYPFQIYYTLPEGDDEDRWILLGNDDQNAAVTYQNSSLPATFVRSYRPPGFTEEQAYKNIYFINPSKSAEIAFPDDTIRYKIVECAVDESVYEKVKINGEDVPDSQVITIGNLKSYSSEASSAQERPSINFDNFVKGNVIKDLFITKKLLDEDNREVTDDPATFSFRLSLSSVPVNADDIPRANMYPYHVLNAEKKMCRFDPELQTFVATEYVYSQENTRLLKEEGLGEYIADDLTFKTSGFGAISGIPSGYTICVPGLPVGSVFKVTEDPKVGYGLAEPDGYVRVMGEKINEDHTHEAIPSYYEHDNNPINIGKVRGEENPQMEVHNKKGYGLKVDKKWSDVALTTGHESVYVAVYVNERQSNGSVQQVLLDGSVRQIQSPATSVNYFWTSLKPRDIDNSERVTLKDYVVKEVRISNSSPTVADDGTVTNYGTLTPVANGETIQLSATPLGEAGDREFDYVVSVDSGEDNGSARNDTITNTRNGGLAVRLFEWDTDHPLRNGNFTLTDQNGDIVGTYTSGSDGIVTMLYEFERGVPYTLTETTAPRGYVGMQKKLCFVVDAGDSVSLFYEDAITPWGTQSSSPESPDNKWANQKPGSNGVIAYVDIYNKPFNFKIEKMDGEDYSISLESAHFALYKQTNTVIGGLEKNRDPVTGFEDMVTDSQGVVYICGGDSGRIINPGDKGSVYFLTETQAPEHYQKLTDDILFRISPLGVPTIVSDSYHGELIETEDSYIYTLSVPNEREPLPLTIEKQVEGDGGSREKDFTFTIEVSGANEKAAFVWSKNGVAQDTPMPYTGGSFTLRHGDNVEIMLPPGVTVTVTEANETYSATFKLGEDAPENLNTKTFMFTEPVTLLVINTLGTIVPTGIMLNTWVSIVFLLVIFAFILLLSNRDKLGKIRNR